MEANMLQPRHRLWSYVYRGHTILQSNVMLVVGDTYGDMIVQAVDYRHRIIYLIDQ